MKFYGIDGCRKGWFYVGINDTDQYEFGVISAFEEILSITENAKQVLVDIPVGLREEEPIERLCDLEARKVLVSRRSSVFPPPSRLALEFNDYTEASRINFQYTGRKLSKQSFAIAKKILAVDKFFILTGLQGKFREMHPEVCFWALNKFSPMKQNKKKYVGYNERRLLLANYFPNTDKLIMEASSLFKRKDLAKDDILDAMVGAVCARFYPNLLSLPTSPESDCKGLIMEIVYPEVI